MSTPIEQLIWGLQEPFRWSVEHETKVVLNELGVASADATVVLVGIATEENYGHAICVDPEKDLLSPDHLVQVTRRAEELYELEPRSQMVYHPPGSGDSAQRTLFLEARAKAIAEAIDGSAVFDRLTFFVSQSSPINGYEVHTCVGIPTGEIGSLPSFEDSKVEGFHAGRSLQHEVIRECLQRSDNAICLPDPGSALSALGRTEDIIASAAERFIRGTMWRTVREPSNLFGALNAVASLTYERAGARGSLTVTSHENLKEWLKVTFKTPVRLRESRTMRKVLQLSNDTMSVLADPTRAYGLGAGESGSDVVNVLITGHAQWEASVNGDKFVRVSYGKATIPVAPIERRELDDVAVRTIGQTDTKRIWEIVQAAQESGQGATIVVSKEPEAEATRLGGQGMPIEPTYLKLEEVVRLASVDGAVIIGPDARCHAFAVILDGVANESGDRARGARFNSAVRYQNMEAAKSMIIVISDDGTIDLLPRPVE